jgi:hypothetical protein
MMGNLGLALSDAKSGYFTLLAIAAVWLVAGWAADRTSHRIAQLWAAAALVVLGTANGVAIMRYDVRWWPLIGGAWGAGEWIAVLLWVAALVLTFRSRSRGRNLGLGILACSIAAFAFGLVAASTGVSNHAGKLCLGQSRMIGPWTVTLRAIKPVADAQYTGVQATLILRTGPGAGIEVRPEQRDYPLAGRSADAGSVNMVRWNGELWVKARSSQEKPECIDVSLAWRPFAQWLRYGAWLSLAAAAQLLAAACHTACWRAAAWQRIMMRREDRLRPAVAAGYRATAWQPVALALMLGLIAMGWQLSQPSSAKSGNGGFINGPAMIAARQSLFPGPHLANRWLIIADALVRHGSFGDAAQVLQGAVENQPDNAEAWLALGDALYGHAGGQFVPAAELAYYRADRAFYHGTRDSNSANLSASTMSRSGRSAAAKRWLRLHPQPAT